MITPSSRSQGNWSLLRAIIIIIIIIIMMMMRAFIFLESNNCSQLQSAKRMPPQELWLQRPAPHQQSLPWRGELCYKTTTIGLDKYLNPPPLCQRPWRQEILVLHQQTVNEVQSGTGIACNTTCRGWGEHNQCPQNKGQGQTPGSPTAQAQLGVKIASRQIPTAGETGWTKTRPTDG